MVLENPINWTEKYQALYNWAWNASGWVVRWADQDAPRPDYPYVLLDVTDTVKEGGIDEVERSVDLTRARDIAITPTAANNQLYRVTINGEDHDYTSDSDATVAEITAGIAAAIAGGSQPVTASDETTHVDVEGDGETLNPTTAQLFNVVLSGPMAWSNNDLGNEVELRVSGMRVVTLNVQAFQRNTDAANAANDPSTNAYNMLTRLQSSLGLPSVLSELRAADIAVVEEQNIVDLSEQVEDTFLSRASMDVRLRTLSVLTEYIGYIETMGGASTFSGSNDSPIEDTYGV